MQSDPAKKRLTGGDKSGGTGVGHFFSALLFFLFLALFTVWLMITINPGRAEPAPALSRPETNLFARFETLSNNLKSDALSGLVYIRKIYRIPEEASVAPIPDPACFGETADPAVVQAVVDRASDLLDGQALSWSPDIPIFPGSVIRYYCDDTILSIVWKEAIGNTVCTFAEVKIADGSQLRRALAGDAYSSDIQLKASDMARAVNSVVAINGDFYAFRQIGVVVYRRVLYRFSPSVLDTCFFTSSGEMLFAHAGELTDAESTEHFLAENDVLFSTSFGPILVEDGRIREIWSYPVGEVFEYFARSAIGVTDTLHYLLMVTSSENSRLYLDGMYASEAARIMQDKGCRQAYELDGGQTAVIIFNGVPANGIVYGSERTMSDILYFASAIPEEGRR